VRDLEIVSYPSVSEGIARGSRIWSFIFAALERSVKYCR
jgi:hypothetical protein